VGARDVTVALRHEEGMGRTASLILVSSHAELLGMLPPMELACPYWPECADVVAEAGARFGARVVVLRLLGCDPARRPGGEVSYLAELESDARGLALLTVPELLRERALERHPKRMPWAEPGGPAASLAWAHGALEATGNGSFRALQQRAWNLSSLWRLEGPTALGPSFWLKQVPPFLAHEARVLGWLNKAVPAAAPSLVAAGEQGRSLLAHVPGEDLYEAPLARRQQILARLHEVQRVAAQAVEELVALGVPDLRGSQLAHDTEQKLTAWLPDYPGLSEILQRLAQKLELLEQSGLPATLVHADNHPGNARGSAHGVTLLDWGEAFVGHPVTDLLGLLQGLSASDARVLKEQWCTSWKTLAPGSQPELALEAASFIAAVRGAATYAHFLRHIEDSEWPYHEQDVPRCLRTALELSG
jgi:hypothetical protein